MADTLYVVKIEPSILQCKNRSSTATIIQVLLTLRREGHARDLGTGIRGPGLGPRRFVQRIRRIPESNKLADNHTARILSLIGPNMSLNATEEDGNVARLRHVKSL